MTPERWQRVKEVFAQASELDVVAQTAFLEHACDDDRELHAEVMSLLRAHATAEAVVDRPALEYLPPGSVEPVPEDWQGRRMGAYELLTCLGRGGMGEVWRARRADAYYEKEVAIKLVRVGYASSFVLQRFRAERQILATLEHPYIARLIDGGVTEEGQPYLVMELVEGQPIDAYCDSGTLPLAERLRLFRQVCAAVSYAHQHLVVHRDLKPSNILVTAEGTIKLLDFGIAKILQPPAADGAPVDATRTTLRALTPAFSSPEQILGLNITTASDVYSLGVVLFHLLAGRSPYRTDLSSTRDAIREVCETEPMRPSTAAVLQLPLVGHARVIPDRDLDDITLKALRKEPERRYSSVEQLSEDVRRYLEGLPVMARGDRFSYRAGKFVRRHRVELAAAGLVAAALLTGIVVTSREARIANQQRARAERHFASVRALANTFMFQMDDSIHDLPGATAARELLVKTALQYLDTLSKEAGIEPGLQLELAKAYQKLGDIQGEVSEPNTGDPKAALSSYSKAIALFAPLAAAAPPNDAIRASLATTHLNHGRLLAVSGDARAGAAESGRAVASFEAIATEHPADLEARDALATAYTNHADVLVLAGDVHAVDSTAAAIGILEDLHRREPQSRDYAFHLASAYNRAGYVAQIHEDQASIDSAVAWHQKARALSEELISADPERAQRYRHLLGASQVDIGVDLYERGDYQGALDFYRQAENTLVSVAADKNDWQTQFDLANVRTQVGDAQRMLGHLDDAERTLQQAETALQAAQRRGDTLSLEFVLASCRRLLGLVEARRANESAADPSTQLLHWRTARGWLGASVAGYQRVTNGGITLFPDDQRDADEAALELARGDAEIARLDPLARRGVTDR